MLQSSSLVQPADGWAFRARRRSAYGAFAMLLCVSAALTAAAPVEAQTWDQRCSAAARGYLMEHGTAPETILSVAVLEELDVGSRPQIVRPFVSQRDAVSRGLLRGFRVRVRLSSCEGLLYLDMNEFCAVRDISARGDCVVPPSADPWADDAVNQSG